MSEEAVAPESSESSESAGQVTEQVNPLQFDPSSMPEGIRNEPSLQTFDSVDKLAKSYVNAVKMIGGEPEKLISLPKEGESWDDLYNKMGRPEQPNGYDFGDDPEGDLDGFREFAHSSGLTQQQAENILNLYNEIQEEEGNSQEQALQDMRTNSEISLQREWGRDYDGNLDYARRAFAQIASPELGQLMDDSGIGSHPEVLKAFSKVGKMLGEDSLVVGSGLGSNRISPEQAKNEIQSLYADKEFSEAYRDNRHPQHKASMKKMDNLFKTAYPGRGKVR